MARPFRHVGPEPYRSLEAGYRIGGSPDGDQDGSEREMEVSVVRIGIDGTADEIDRRRRIAVVERDAAQDIQRLGVGRVYLDNALVALLRLCHSAHAEMLVRLRHQRSEIRPRRGCNGSRTLPVRVFLNSRDIRPMTYTVALCSRCRGVRQQPRLLPSALAI